MKIKTNNSMYQEFHNGKVYQDRKTVDSMEVHRESDPYTPFFAQFIRQTKLNT